MRLLADENLNNHIFRSLLLQRPGLDIVRVQDVGLSGKSDPELLAWAIAKNRTLITQDVLFKTLAVWITIAVSKFNLEKQKNP